MTLVGNRRALAAALLLVRLRRKRRERKIRRWWVHPVNLKRKRFGEYHHLIQELEEHPERWFLYFHMSKDKFELLLEYLEEEISPGVCNLREPITARERLVVTLR